MAIITDTYTDEDVVKNTYIVAELYDTTTLSTNIANHAAEAKKWVNTQIGRQADFTAAELAEIRNEGIVSAACVRTACTMERKRQEVMGELAEDTKVDCELAEKTLYAWMARNGILPPDTKISASVSVKASVVYSESGYVI